MLSVPPKSKAGFVVIGVLAGLILTIAHLPHHAAGPGPGVGARPFPFLPDLTTLRLPGCTTPLVELGGPYGGSTEGEDHLDEGRQHPELIKKEDEGWLQGEVGYALFDRLKPDEYYITVGNGAGVSNQVFGIMDALYLALLSSRIPILQPLHAGHHIYREPSAPAHPELDVSELFDLPRLIRDVPRLRGYLQWSDFYPSLTSNDPDLWHRFANTDEEREWWPQVGCWGEFVTGKVLEVARMRTDWTPYPPLVARPDRHMSFLDFIPYLLPQSPFAATLPYNPEVLRPNDHLACIDEGMSGTDRGDASPVDEMLAGKSSWAGIGRHLHFTPELEKEAARIVANAFGWEGEGHGNKHITLHIRRNDFPTFMCHDDDPCYSVSQYLRAVQDIQATLEEPIENILVLTDEHDPAYIEQARALGWKFAEDGKNGPGGEEVKEKFGGWYDVLTDIVLMSSGSHFVGTKQSTMSILALRRVEDWYGGETRLVGPGDPESIMIDLPGTV